MAAIAATIGGALTLKILTDVGKWDWWWLIAAGGTLVGGTLVVRFVPDFYYRIRFPWARILTGFAVAIGGLSTLSALQSPSHWEWWHWLGTGILVVSGIIYLLLPDIQREKFNNRGGSLQQKRGDDYSGKG